MPGFPFAGKKAPRGRDQSARSIVVQPTIFRRMIAARVAYQVREGFVAGGVIHKAPNSRYELPNRENSSDAGLIRGWPPTCVVSYLQPLLVLPNGSTTRLSLDPKRTVTFGPQA